jgi:hypothetical protein
MLIGHKQEIEHHLTETFLKIKPDVVGNKYFLQRQNAVGLRHG